MQKAFSLQIQIISLGLPQPCLPSEACVHRIRQLMSRVGSSCCSATALPESGSFTEPEGH